MLHEQVTYNMSQNDLLQHSTRWRAEDAAEKLLETLAGLLDFEDHQEQHKAKSETLKNLFQMALSYFPIEDLENKLFHQLMPKLDLTFSSLLTEIKIRISSTDGMVNDLQTLIADILQLSCSLLECLQFCLCHISSENYITANHIYSLPSSTLNIIQESYIHCKESPTIYGDYLEASNEPLTELFEKTGSVLTMFVGVAEKLVISSQIADEVLLLSTMLDYLRKISQVVCELDVKLMASLWKTYVKIAVQYVDDIKDHVDVASAIRALSQHITSDLESIALKTLSGCTGSDIEKTVVKSLRIAGFNMKILVLLCDKYSGYLGDCATDVIELIFTLYRNFPPSTLAPRLSQTLFDEMERQLIIGIDLLLTHLASDREFVTCLTSKSEVLSEKEPFLFCLLSSYILEKIPRLEDLDYDLWVRRNPLQTSVVDKVFKCLPACHVELMTPVRFSGIMCQGKPQRKVSFYEHLCTRLCGFVASFPARHFATLEQVLLKNLLSTFHWCQLLAADVWAFLARIGSAELCWNHCCLLADLLTKCGEVQTCSLIYVENLLNRLIHFLATEHLELFVLKYSIKEHPWIWSNFVVTKQSCASLQKQMQATAVEGLTYLHNLLEQPSNGSYSELALALSLVTCGIKAASVTKAECLMLKEIQVTCIRLWNTELTQEGSVASQTLQVLLNLILLTSHLLPHFGSTNTLEVLTIMKPLLLMKHDSINLGFIDCLWNLKKKFFSPSPEQTHILTLLSDLFGQALQDTNWLVLTSSLETFSVFAHETNHTEIIPMCFQLRPHLQETVSGYLSKIPFGGSFSVDSLSSFLNKEKDVLVVGRQSSKEESVQKPVKRLRSDSSDVIHVIEHIEDHPEVNEYLSALQNNIGKLKDIAEVHGFSIAATKRLEEISTELGSLLTEFG